MMHAEKRSERERERERRREKEKADSVAKVEETFKKVLGISVYKIYYWCMCTITET